MRLLLIRHAENRMNEMIARYEVEILRGRLSPKEGRALFRQHDVDLDAPLSEVGFTQADALAKYWGPLTCYSAPRLSRMGATLRADVNRLQPYQESERLHMFVSPFLRTMQTAAPLAAHLGIRPIVKPELSETFGLMFGTDRSVVYPKIMEAQARGDWDTVARIDAEMEGRWIRGGLRGSEIKKRFSSYDLDESFVDDEPWCRYGAESRPRIRRRIAGVIEWLKQLQENLPDDHTVALVIHQGTINNLLRGLLSNFGDSPTFPHSDNTSVTSIVLNKQGGGTKPRLFAGSGIPMTVEFMNRVDHLVAVHEMDRISGFLHGASPEQHHYDRDPHHDAFMRNLHETTTVPSASAARELVSKL